MIVETKNVESPDHSVLLRNRRREKSVYIGSRKSTNQSSTGKFSFLLHTSTCEINEKLYDDNMF